VTWLVALTAALGTAATGPALPAAAQADSLMAVTRRATAQWMAHDFAGLLGSGEAVMVHLPGAEPSSPLRPAHAAELLGEFAEDTRELDLTVLVVRKVDPDRAYVEAQRDYQVLSTAVQRTETLYLGFRRVGTSWHLVEIRALP